MPLPDLNPSGFLPEGIHDSSLREVEKQFVHNPHRVALWKKFHSFIEWIVPMQRFSHLYIDGGFITAKTAPEDIDIILQTRQPYGPGALECMAPFFAYGMDKVLATYAIHLHFWSEGFPGGIHDFRRFFQYVRPRETVQHGVARPTMKGIVRVAL
jgi:hypothetical protein